MGSGLWVPGENIRLVVSWAVRRRSCWWVRTGAPCHNCDVRYETIDHTADAGIVVYGSSLEELLENAAYGMFDLMFDLSVLRAGREIDVTLEDGDPDELLYRWLSELLYRFEVDDVVPVDTTVEVGDTGLKAQLRCVDAGALELRGTPIKAVTLHDLQVTRRGDGWMARVLFDV
jgi:SHS2 domain-containing protein